MSETMKPTIGRIVLFKYSETQTFPAIVTSVHEKSEMISVAVFTDTHVEFFAPIRHSETELHCWHWMAYQKDQQLRAGALLGGASVMSEDCNCKDNEACSDCPKE